MTPTPFIENTEGVFFGLPAEQYHAAPGVSQSTLKKFGEEPTPKHYQDSLKKPRKVTPEMEFGTILHTSVLEPEKVVGSYYVRPAKYKGDDGTMRPWHGGAKVCKEWEAKNNDKPVIDTEQFDSIPAILASVNRHPRFSAMLESGRREVSYFKRDEETGLLLKCRCDLMAQDSNEKTFIGDPKFTFRGGASREEFQKQAELMGYDIQMASYLFITGASHFVFMVCERESPFESCEWELEGVNEKTGEDYRVGGMRKYRALLNRYAECVANNSWPGYPDALKLEPSKYYKSN